MSIEPAGWVAALWRRVRWGAALFALVQFAAYTPTPGIAAPAYLVPLGVGLTLTLVLVNVAATVVERRAPRVPRARYAPARRDLALLGVDAACAAVLVVAFAFDPGAALWVLLVIPLLEASLLGRLRLGLLVWAGCVLVLVAQELVASGVFDLPTSVINVVVSRVGYRCGVLLFVALIVGTQATAAHRHLLLLEATRRQLQHEATHDHLTGLAGRSLFLHRAQQALSDRRGHGALAVLYVDCDLFKEVNDTHGHATGDAVLIEVGRRLSTAVRPGDTVARLGGDEFAVLLQTVSPAEAVQVRDRVAEALGDPYPSPHLADPVPMSCSIGLAHLDDVDHGLKDLLHRADEAMYQDKAASRLPRATGAGGMSEVNGKNGESGSSEGQGATRSGPKPAAGPRG